MRPSTSEATSPQPALPTALVYQYVLAATSAILVHMLLRSIHADFGGSSDDTVAYQQHSEDPSSSSSSSSCGPSASARRPSATSSSVPSRGADSIHQTGTKYRSNNAGDGPEKTRDRKSWFPRFKSNWLGTYRSKQMFHCCECAVVDAASARYKGSEGKHCVCGQDQWHLAKTIEEAEYNRRMEISKALGGLRYDEALERLKAMGTSELDLKRLRCESDEASVTSSSTSSSVGDDTADGPQAASAKKRIKNEPLPSPATRAYGSQQRAKAAASFGLDPVTLPSVNASTGLTAELLQKINQSYSSGSYTPLSGDYLGGAASYDHLVPASFADEENFGELLQGFLEDDPRHVSGSGYYQPHQQPHSRQPQYNYNNAASYIPGSSASMSQQPHHHRYPQALSTLPTPPQVEVDFEFFSDGHHRAMAPGQVTSSSSSGYYGQPHHGTVPHGSQYGRPHLAHPHNSMAAPLASSTSFSIV